MAARSAIFGCKGPVLAPDEAAFFREADPWGFILFLRNVEAPDQLRRLTSDLREAVGRDAPVLIDQEGGRVARLLPPHWTAWENAFDFVQNIPPEARARAMRLRYQAIALELRAVGIDVNCAPMADVATAATHQDIRERCYSADPAEVARLSRSVAEGLMAGGVLPVVKHMPGHGRTPLDSHRDLPRVEATLPTLDVTDFVPFRALSDLPMAMTAHIVFDALDSSAPMTLSRAGVTFLRDSIGFGGLLLTDDLSMGALRAPMAERVVAAQRADCDIALHCNGDRSEMEAVAGAALPLSGTAAARAERVLSQRAGLAAEAEPLEAVLEALRGLQAREVGYA